MFYLGVEMKFLPVGLGSAVRGCVYRTQQPTLWHDISCSKKASSPELSRKEVIVLYFSCFLQVKPSGCIVTLGPESNSLLLVTGMEPVSKFRPGKRQTCMASYSRPPPHALPHFSPLRNCSCPSAAQSSTAYLAGARKRAGSVLT